MKIYSSLFAWRKLDKSNKKKTTKTTTTLQLSGGRLNPPPQNGFVRVVEPLGAKSSDKRSQLWIIESRIRSKNI